MMPGSAHRLVHAALAIALSIAALLAAPAPAHAGDIEDFQAARALYDAHDWPRAITAFEALVGGDPPRLQSRPLVLESRKYLAVAYVFVGRERAASDQLEQLLTDEPTYELDATQFPREVVQLFDRVRARLLERRSAQAERSELERDVTRLRSENEALRAALAGERTLEVPRSLWLVQIPFGVGQFENGEDGLGWFFLVTEALAAIGAITTTAVHLGYLAFLQDNAMGVPRDTWDRVNDALHIVAPMNWAFLGALGVLGVTGVVQANVAYSPTRTVRVPAAAPSVSLRVSPAFVGLSGAF